MRKIKMNKTIRNLHMFYTCGEWDSSDDINTMISYRYGRTKNTIVVEILKVDYDLYKKYKLEDYKMQLEMMDSCEYTDEERDEALARMIKFKTFYDTIKYSLVIDEIRFDLQYKLDKELEFKIGYENHVYFNIIGDINWEEF